METLEKSVKYVIDVIDVVLMFLLLTLDIFHTFFGISIADFEHVNVSWESCNLHKKDAQT